MGSDEDLSGDEHTEQNGTNAEFQMATRGDGPNTGPKGVIADYKDYQRQKAQERHANVEKLIAEANRFSLNQVGS